MKQYIYDKETSLVLMDMGGRQFTLKRGDVVEARSDGDYDFGSHTFIFTRENLRESFERIYTKEELDRYERIFEKALVASMQSLIANLEDKEINIDVCELEIVPKNAIWFATQLVNELKEKEF